MLVELLTCAQAQVNNSTNVPAARARLGSLMEEIPDGDA